MGKDGVDWVGFDAMSISQRDGARGRDEGERIVEEVQYSRGCEKGRPSFVIVLVESRVRFEVGHRHLGGSCRLGWNA